MKKKFIGTWKDAFFASPGPVTARKALILSLKGLCMGSADVIPGVSGGTIALITGIYKDLLGALKSFDWQAVQKILVVDIKGALASVHIRFVLALFTGIIIAVLSLARLMNYLLHYHPVPTWSFFFGLITASIFVVGKKVVNWYGRAGISFLVGIFVASIIVNLIPITTPEELWFIFFCGIVAICAMILPGISGAFILLILGKYEFITATLKNPFLFQNIIVILVFCFGCAIGLAGFSRVLNNLLEKYNNLNWATMLASQLIEDASELNQMILQWMSISPTAKEIDSHRSTVSDTFLKFQKRGYAICLDKDQPYNRYYQRTKK